MGLMALIFLSLPLCQSAGTNTGRSCDVTAHGGKALGGVDRLHTAATPTQPNWPRLSFPCTQSLSAAFMTSLKFGKCELQIILLFLLCFFQGNWTKRLISWQKISPVPDVDIPMYNRGPSGRPQTKNYWPRTAVKKLNECLWLTVNVVTN